uniref:Ricin B-type lectin domain-containing protein n=1 Tax=Caenorhabditis tropicalis TaxID=1561998 RepID=A0A1I7UZF5_9PELO
MDPDELVETMKKKIKEEVMDEEENERSDEQEGPSDREEPVKQRLDTMVMEKNGWLTQAGMCLTLNQPSSGEYQMFGSHCDVKNGAQRWVFEKLESF